MSTLREALAAYPGSRSTRLSWHVSHYFQDWMDTDTHEITPLMVFDQNLEANP